MIKRLLTLFLCGVMAFSLPTIISAEDGNGSGYFTSSWNNLPDWDITISPMSFSQVNKTMNVTYAKVINNNTVYDVALKLYGIDTTSSEVGTWLIHPAGTTLAGMDSHSYNQKSLPLTANVVDGTSVIGDPEYFNEGGTMSLQIYSLENKNLLVFPKKVGEVVTEVDLAPLITVDTANMSYFREPTATGEIGTVIIGLEYIIPQS